MVTVKNGKLTSEKINEMFSNFKFIDKNNEEIKKYLPKDGSEILYSDIAHLYLHLSVEVYNILKNKTKCKCKLMGKCIRKLEKGFDEIIGVLTIIGRKKPEKKGETKELIDEFNKDREESKDTIIQNKKLLFDSISHYCAVMELVESKRFKVITFGMAFVSFIISLILIICK